jgi:hypothetical protein
MYHITVIQFPQIKSCSFHIFADVDEDKLSDNKQYSAGSLIELAGQKY